MAITIQLPEKLTNAEIKALNEKQRAKIQAQVDKIVAKGHLVDDYDISTCDENDRRTLVISIYHYEPDASGYGVRRRSSGVRVQGERSIAAKVLKEAKAVVKGLNQGLTYPSIVCVATGRPRGRSRLVAA